MSEIDQKITWAILKHEKEAAERIANVISSEQKLRHAVVKKVQADYIRIDKSIQENNTDIALLKQNDDNMAEKVQEIKVKMEEGFSRMEDKIEKKLEGFITELKLWYATKGEHEENKKSISWIVRVMWTLLVPAVLWGATFILNYLINK